MLTLQIDRARHEAHLKSVQAELPGLVPVAKGNGYGLGNDRLAAAAAALGCDTLAVGTFAEACRLAGGEAFDRVVVLTPHLSGDSAEGLPSGLLNRVVRTIAAPMVPAELAGSRVVVECRTSLCRHGVTAEDLPGLATALTPVVLDGFALHLPMNRPAGVDPVAEVAAWLQRLEAAGLPTGTMYVSHLSGSEVGELGRRFPATTFRPRVGTRLWLGDRGALRVRAQVRDVERLARGQRFGYRQRRSPRAGHLVVVAGGTAHGIGLAAPRSVAGPVARAKVAAEAGLAGVNLALSPFSWAGRRRWFGEPPHMQVSLLWLPDSVDPPAVGDLLDAEMRMTTATFDEVVET